MIWDLSYSLRDLLMKAGSAFTELGSSEIVFDRPTDGFNPTHSTLSLYLYDVRENVELRSIESTVSRINGTAYLQRAPLRVACSYLLTAWPGSSLKGDELARGEHHLLGQALTVFARNPQLPEQYLHDSLKGQDPPVPLVTAHGDGLKNPSEFWTAINNKLRPSLTVMATISIPAYDPVSAPLVTTSRLSVAGGGRAEAELYRIGGVVTRDGSAAISGAQIAVRDTRLAATTDSDGRYEIGGLAKGNYTLRVSNGAVSKDVSIQLPPPDPAGTDPDAGPRPDRYDVVLG